MNKPKDIESYKEWLEKKHGIIIADQTAANYDRVTSKIKLDFEKSGFWVQLIKNLKEYNDEYHLERGYGLLMPNPTYELNIKSFDSFLLKTFKKNIIKNKNWPEPPDNGWILPNNWYTRINDTVRTLIIVKYLDGVEFLVNKIKLFCNQNQLICKDYMEATNEGYYAAHLYIDRSVEIPKTEWDTKKIDISIEIQITTQLQEVIKNLLHKYYEEKKKCKNKIKTDIKWQWNYRGEEFAANYLGHILHYIEGMIVEIREKQKEEERRWKKDF